MSKVILLHIDGCRVDTLQAAETPNIHGLMRTGAWSMNARTIAPPITLPVHFSIFTSMNSIGHGVLTNGARPNVSPSAMGIVGWLKAHGKTTAMYYNWEFLRELAPPGSLDISIFLNSAHADDGDMRVAEVAASDITLHQPDFAFVYLGCPDEVGHSCGFSSDEYRQSLEKADQAIGYLLNSLKENSQLDDYVILFQSDHGGIGYDHTSQNAEVMTVPWILNGPGVTPGEIHLKSQKKMRQISVMDSIPTLAYCLNVPCHHSWQGRAVVEAFTCETERIDTHSELRN